MMRTDEQVLADAADERAFSNHSEYEVWAGGGQGCYDCANDDESTEKWCPILGAALLGKWPTEWTRRTYRPDPRSAGFVVVDECTEFVQRPEWPGDDDPDDGPDPEPEPVIEGQVDMFEVFTDQIVEHIESAVRA